MILVGAIVRLKGPAPAVAAKLIAVPPVPVIVPELTTLPFVGAPKPAPASLNTIPVRPVMVPPRLLVIVRLSPKAPRDSAVMLPELMIVAGVPETPIDRAPIPCTVPEFVSVLLVVPPKDTPTWPCTVPPDCTVTPTEPVPGPPAPIPLAVLPAAIVLVPLTLMVMPPVPELLMFRASPLPVLVMLP